MRLEELAARRKERVEAVEAALLKEREQQRLAGESPRLAENKKKNKKHKEEEEEGEGEEADIRWARESNMFPSKSPPSSVVEEAKSSGESSSLSIVELPAAVAAADSRESEYFFSSEIHAERESVVRESAAARGVTISGISPRSDPPGLDGADKLLLEALMEEANPGQEEEASLLDSDALLNALITGDGGKEPHDSLLDALNDAERVADEQAKAVESLRDPLLDAVMDAERVAAEHEAPEDPYLAILRQSSSVDKERARQAMMSVIALKADRVSSRPSLKSSSSPIMPSLLLPQLPRVTTAAAKEPSEPNRRLSPRKALPSAPVSIGSSPATSPRRGRALPQPPPESPRASAIPRESVATLLHRTRALPHPPEGEQQMTEEEEDLFAFYTDALAPSSSTSPSAGAIYVPKALPAPPTEDSSSSAALVVELRQEIARLQEKLRQVQACRTCGAQLGCLQCGGANSRSPLASPRKVSFATGGGHGSIPPSSFSSSSSPSSPRSTAAAVEDLSSLYAAAAPDVNPSARAALLRFASQRHAAVQLEVFLELVRIRGLGTSDEVRNAIGKLRVRLLDGANPLSEDATSALETFQDVSVAIRELETQLVSSVWIPFRTSQAFNARHGSGSGTRSPQRSPLGSPRGGATTTTPRKLSSPPARWARPANSAAVFSFPHRFVHMLLEYLPAKDRSALRASDPQWDEMFTFFDGVNSERMTVATALYEDCKEFRSQMEVVRLYADVVSESRACSDHEMAEIFGPTNALGALNKLMVQRLRERLIGGPVDGTVWTSFTQFISSHERELRFVDSTLRQVVSRPAVYSHLIVARKAMGLPEFSSLPFNPLVRLKALQKSVTDFGNTCASKAEQSSIAEANRLLGWAIGRLMDFKQLVTVVHGLAKCPLSLKPEALRGFDLLLDAVMEDVVQKKSLRLILLSRCWLVCRQKLPSLQWTVIFEGNSMGSSTGFRRCSDDPLIVCIQHETRSFVFRAQNVENEARTTRALSGATYLTALPPQSKAQLTGGREKKGFLKRK